MSIFLHSIISGLESWSGIWSGIGVKFVVETLNTVLQIVYNNQLRQIRFDFYYPLDPENQLQTPL